MFEQEASWVAGALSRLGNLHEGVLLNLGSSDLVFRTLTQPWIDAFIFAPLRAKGIAVVHNDIKESSGIDIRADILSTEGFARLKALRPTNILCCNLLEHIEEPVRLARACLALLPPGGHVVVTVPLSYPYHRDPIDTLYRPTPDELAKIFAGVRMIESTILEPGSYREEVARRPWLLLRPLFRLPFPFLGWTRWKRSLKRLYWLVRPYKITCAVFRKEA
jgi:SAM-dependent methyltransferase